MLSKKIYGSHQATYQHYTLIKCFGGVMRGYIIYQLYIYMNDINRICERARKTSGHVHAAVDLQLSTKVSEHIIE
jgi:hypothetical protein